jgi:8-oxo-dGTP pyrophosphatase MutT (NUDIX family)
MAPGMDLTVAAVIEHNARFLVVEELVGGRRVLTQPAGHIEPGETLEAAVIREVLEESGYHFTPLTVLGIFSWHDESRSYLRITFSGEVESPAKEQCLDEGIIATHWLTKQELLARSSMLRSPMVMSCIERYEHGIHYPLSLVDEMLHGCDSVANIA